MAYCLTAPSYCLNQCWLIISEVVWKNFTLSVQSTILYNGFEKYAFITSKSPRGQWVAVRLQCTLNNSELWNTECWTNGGPWRRHQMEIYSVLLPFVRGIHRSLVVSLTKTSEVELWCFLWSAPQQMIEQTMEMPVIWDATTVFMMSL